MPNFLKDNEYKWGQIGLVSICQIINPLVNKSKSELEHDIDKLNLLTIVLRRDVYRDEFNYEVDEYVCVDNHELLALRILQKVKVVHAVVI